MASITTASGSQSQSAYTARRAACGPADSARTAAAPHAADEGLNRELNGDGQRPSGLADPQHNRCSRGRPGLDGRCSQRWMWHDVFVPSKRVQTCHAYTLWRLLL